jgi:hypothetical protein
VGTEPVDFCRAIESYLCQKNDGHLVRVTGPSFDVVSGWAARGIPLKIAFQGIDRYFERYYHQGPRRRPVRIDFCDADVLDVYHEWLRALGLPRRRAEGEGGENSEGGPAEDDQGESGPAAGGSLPAHLQRVVLRLTSARALGRLTEEFEDVLDRVARELDAARASARGIRGPARQALLQRLATIDRELLATARRSLDAAVLAEVERDAADDLTSFRERMTPEAYERARGAAVDRLIRNRLQLPTVAFV